MRTPSQNRHPTEGRRSLRPYEIGPLDRVRRGALSAIERAQSGTWPCKRDRKTVVSQLRPDLLPWLPQRCGDQTACCAICPIRQLPPWTMHGYSGPQDGLLGTTPIPQEVPHIRPLSFLAHLCICGWHPVPVANLIWLAVDREFGDAVV